MRLRIFPMVFCLVFSLAGIAHSRISRAWTYQQLRDGSDLVVVAHPVEARCLDEKHVLTGISRMPSNGNDTQYHAQGVETKFRVLTTLKGAELQAVVLHHYRKADNDPEINGPSFMEFDSKACDNYLLFLKKRNDGQYEGVAGQVDLILSVKNIGCI